MSDGTLVITGMGCLLMLALVGAVTVGTLAFQLMLWWLL